MSEIKFDFIYKGTHQFHHKKYYLDEFINKSLKELSDVHSQMPLIAKREYTGLKDKNGVEIYKGDILHGGGLNYNLIWEDGKACELHNSKDKYSPLFMFKHLKSIEVVGNIYENKELLT